MKPVAEKIVTLAIVDDHNLFRKGLGILINLSQGKYCYELLFEAGNGNEMQRSLKKGLVPDIVILDIDMDVMDGYKCAEWLRENYPAISILVITMYNSDEAIRRMLRYGVKGYLNKDVDVADMQTALENIAAGDVYFSNRVVQLVADNISQEAETFGGDITRDVLSKKEQYFLQLVCTELPYHKIAKEMSLSPKTIDGYREELFRRFGVHTRVSLALFAVKKGLVILS
jgi:DNA-binding NarL/FixJ family response regulator